MVKAKSLSPATVCIWQKRVSTHWALSGTGIARDNIATLG
jgi:hypothetical protein